MELVAKVVETQRQIADFFPDQGHGGLQVITFGARDADFALLDGGLHLHLVALDELLDFLGLLGFYAVAHLGDLLDLVAADFFDLADVQEAHVNARLGQLVAQNVVDLVDLELTIANQGDVLVFQLDRGGGALEVKACADFLGGIFHGVFDLDHIGFEDSIKRRHERESLLEKRDETILRMLVEKNVPLQFSNTFGIVAKALSLVRVAGEADIGSVLADPALRAMPKFVLGGGSNIVLTGDVKPLVLKVEIMGKRLVSENAKAWIVEAGAGESWHDLVSWTLQNGYPGLENLALIPGTVGASPVQNIGAYGVELQDRFESLDAIDLTTGQGFTLNAAQCAFGYRDSVFKHKSSTGDSAASTGNPGFGLADKALITRVRFALPKNWKPVLGYADIEKKMAQSSPQPLSGLPSALQIYEWICEIRRAKLPDPQVIGNAGSFFKNPTVTPEQCADIIQREPKIVHYPMDDGSIKLAAGWLIDACGWKGKSIGNAGVYERQALVLVNRGGKADPVTGGEVMTLAKAIQTSVYERFGIMLEHEPVVV